MADLDLELIKKRVQRRTDAYDPQYVARRLADDVPALIAEVERLHANLAKLAADKGETWEDGYQAGCSMSHSLGCDAVEGERDALREQVSRLTAELNDARFGLGETP